MSDLLALSVTLLDNRYHGRFADGEVEWPPSPFRLFQALLAGASVGGAPGDADLLALRWLERQPPPTIVAPLPTSRGWWKTYVPNNQSDQVFDRHRRLTGKDAHYALFPPGVEPCIHYLWSWAEDVPWEPLQQLACRLVALGWGVDQAIAQARRLSGAVAATLDGVRWHPHPFGPPTLHPHRVPCPGSLDDLQAAYSSRRALLPLPRLYHHPHRANLFNSVFYLPVTQLPPRPCAAFHLPEGLALRPENSAALAAMVRGLTIARARADGLADAETFVAGHTGQRPDTPPRFSYLPLPSIGHPHADGLLRRVLVAEPVGGDGARARWAEAALHNAMLTDEKGNQLGRLRTIQGADGVVERYRSPSQHWHTVTPVVLPGFDDRQIAKAARLLRACLGHAGVPPAAVTDVHLQKSPLWPGANHPRHYFRPAYLRHLPAWHLRLAFAAPVGGPLALGAGRHVGLGILAAP